jgi:glyoxylase-like metal-dependent hydrolase (beta-lactamase superfamily II)
MTIIKHVSHSVFQENTYILLKNDHVLIIDPGDEIAYINAYLKNKNHKVLAVLATHGHLDHITAAKILCEQYSCPFIMSSKDADVLESHEDMCRYFSVPYFGTPVITVDIANQSELILGEFNVNILHTPGHTPGSVCYVVDDVLFSGDTLFYRSVGRTDLPGGNQKMLFASIKEQIYTLDNSITVYPGHMDITNIADEKKYNPYIKAEE